MRDDHGDLSESEWLLLHELRLRGVVAAGGTAYLRLVSVSYIEQRGGMLALSETGRRLHANWAQFEPGSDAAVAAQEFADGFDVLNAELLATCSTWQVTRFGVVNDHLDIEYDWKVIDRLERLHGRVSNRSLSLVAAAPRFGRHLERLSFALDRISSERASEWFTSPRIDSYHTVWNQFHEDLLLALGQERTT